jgi:hypothetical protein
MVSVLHSSVIDHGLQTNCIGGVIVSVLHSSVIDHGLQTNCIGDVIVSVLHSSVIDHGLQTKTIKLVLAASVRGKTGWLRIWIMCPSGATCLPAGWCISELALYKYN